VGVDVDPKVLADSAAASAHAYEQATIHIGEEIKARDPSNLSALIGSLAPTGPYAYTILGRAGADGSVQLPILTTRDGPVVGDLIYIDNLIDCIVQAAARDDVRGAFNLTNNEPVVIREFLFDLFRLLDLPLPRRRVPVRTAMLAAGAIELLHGLFLPSKEPPITRFGIHVFAYSKTFDVARMLATMGPPRVSIAEGLERTVEWVRSC